MIQRFSYNYACGDDTQMIVPAMGHSNADESPFLCTYEQINKTVEIKY